jgi:hypothetical protein
MDQTAVREHAQKHGDAVVQGDLKKAGGDLTEEARAGAGPVMGKLPKPVVSAEVISVDADGGDFIALIRYAGDNEETTVESRWTERQGRPMITELRVP